MSYILNFFQSPCVNSVKYGIPTGVYREEKFKHGFNLMKRLGAEVYYMALKGPIVLFKHENVVVLAST